MAKMAKCKKKKVTLTILTVSTMKKELEKSAIKRVTIITALNADLFYVFFNIKITISYEIVM